MNDTPDLAAKPITDDDATIAKALEDVSVPALLMSLIHMSGDASLLDGDLRPAGIFLNEVQGFLPEEDQARARALALDVIRTYRDGGCKLPPPPDRKTIQKMMSFIVAGDVPDEYVPRMIEEMGLADNDDVQMPGDLHESAEAAMHVIIIGAGMAGILAAIRLEAARIPYTVIEKNDGVGGTWFENRYPGARVDVGNHFYCYSFEPNNEWTAYFAQQPELRGYFERCARKYEVVDKILFRTEVTAAQYDEGSGTWNVTVRRPNGANETLRANAVISATGQLNRPKIPEIPGRGEFKGPAMHSAAWDTSVNWHGKRIAVIGTGASAFQIVPTIAEKAAHVTVFQRSAPWMFPNPNYHARVGRGVKWALEHLPYYGRWYRFLLFWPGCDGGLDAMRVDPRWEHPERAVSELNDATREAFTAYLAEQVGDDAALLEKVVPDYVCLGKRTLQDNGSWLTALQRKDVELVTTPIDRIVDNGVLTNDGTRHEADILVYATGFHANRFLWPMEIVGRDGVRLSDQWGDDPSAYLGITTPNFPNLFFLYGPGTNLAHGGSIVFHAECQMRYVEGCLRLLLERGAKVLECKQEVHDAYMERFDQAHRQMIWMHPSIKNSWYRNESGRVTVLSPWRLVDYWGWTRKPEAEDFRLD